jgi:predicted HAD superfamily Cof-like phosphohydrolase
MSTRSEKVKIFTQESLNINLPDKPRKMTREEVFFVVKMNCEELMELLATVNNGISNPKEDLLDIVNNKTKTPEIKNLTNNEIIAEQVDAFVDIDYYNCNAACKVGMNVDGVFDLVHQANMNKKFEDGTFHKNNEGKIIKPENWKEANLVEIIENWKEFGTWV